MKMHFPLQKKLGPGVDASYPRQSITSLEETEWQKLQIVYGRFYKFGVLRHSYRIRPGPVSRVNTNSKMVPGGASINRPFAWLHRRTWQEEGGGGPEEGGREREAASPSIGHLSSHLGHNQCHGNEVASMKMRSVLPITSHFWGCVKTTYWPLRPDSRFTQSFDPSNVK